MKFILEEERLEVLRDAPWRTGNVLCLPTASIFPAPAEPVQGAPGREHVLLRLLMTCLQSLYFILLPSNNLKV